MGEDMHQDESFSFKACPQPLGKRVLWAITLQGMKDSSAACCTAAFNILQAKCVCVVGAGQLPSIQLLQSTPHTPYLSFMITSASSTQELLGMTTYMLLMDQSLKDINAR
eukprot:1160247-Pelagomonas_calceolata.AAC.12